VPSAVDAAGRSHVDEFDAFCLKAAMAADRVAPIGVAPIRDNIAGFQRLGQPVQNVIDGSPRRNVQQHHARRLQLLAKPGERLDLDKTRLLQLIGRAAAGQADDAHSSLERQEGKSTAHLAKTDHTKFTAVCHALRRVTSIFSPVVASPNHCVQGHPPADRSRPHCAGKLTAQATMVSK
jgi:hypothetical protein